MSCPDCNSNYNCSSPVDNPCAYDNCGCLNPTTFNCTTYTGLDLQIIAKKDDAGDVILKAIDDKLVDLNANKGKVLSDASDTTLGNLVDKLEQGTNIAISVVGTGSARKVRIDSSTGGVIPDVNAKVSVNDTTSDYLSAKLDVGTFLSKSVVNPAGNEKFKFDVNVAALLSADLGNQLAIGSDGKIKTSFAAPDGTETKLIEGTGMIISGTGSVADPYILSTNPSIQALRPCFDGIWRDVTLQAISNTNVVALSGKPQYRYRHDGSIEFRGSMSFTVAFGNYASANRKFTISLGTIPTSCLTVSEQGGTSDLKNINYIDAPQASTDQITQVYGYTVRKSTNTLIVEFQSSFTNNTSKTVVVNFDGAVSHPTLS
jgi:hypothetical protein